MKRRESTLVESHARRIRLPDHELNPPPPVESKPPLVPERPFDLTAFTAKVKARRNSPHDVFDAPGVVTGEEARFWLLALNYSRHLDQCLTPLPLEVLRAGFESLSLHYLSLPLLKLQASWLSPADLTELTVRLPSHRYHPVVTIQIMPWLREEVWSRADAVAMEAVQARFRTLLRDPDRNVSYPAALLARDADVDADLLAFVEGLTKESLPPGFSEDGWSGILLGLKDRGQMLAQFRRLGLTLGTADDARLWLARTQHDGLEILADSILVQRRAEDVVRMLDVLLLAESPEAAKALLRVRLLAKPAKVAGKVAKWLVANSAHSVAGLTELAEEQTKLGEAARTWLEDHGKRTGTATATAPPAARPAAVPRPAAPPAPPAPERKLNLSAEDWARLAPPGNSSPLPAPRPFDLDQCKAWALARPEVPPVGHDESVTAEEARFWLIVNSRETYERDSAIKKMTAKLFSQPTTLEEVKKASAAMHYWACNLPTIRLQRWTLAPVDFVEALSCDPIFEYSTEEARETARWLASEYYPRLDEATMVAVRERLRSLLQGKPTFSTMVAATLARHAGMEADLAAWVAGIKKGGIAPSLVANDWAAALFGIKDAGRLVAEFRWLGLRLTNPGDARQWLALTGHDGLDILRDSILALRREQDQRAMLDVLLLAESPEAAVALLEVKLLAKPPEAVALIDAWLKEHSGHAAAGLTPLSADPTPLGEAARGILGISAAAGPPSADWLREGLAAVKPAKAPPLFADPVVLPAVPGLGVDDVPRLLGALQASTLPGPHPLVSALRRNGDRAALAAFAWKLYEGWIGAGAPSKEKWAFLALGHFGDDAAVMALTPLIRAWPGESQHQRAVTGLEVLRAIGTDVALVALNGIALKLKFKGLQDRAREMMELIAKDRKLTREQLEDRIVPNLGLDAAGGRDFDFGPRRFRLSLDSDLAPALTDESGKVVKDLPKPGAKDDAARAKEAVEAWKAFKKQLRETLKIQLFRLEEAMVTGRGWTPEEFDALLVRHPLLGILARRLLWSGHDAAGATVCLFRLDENGATLGHDQWPVSLEGVASVRVAHRLRMTAGQLGSWREVFDDLDLVHPFPQLDREVFAPTTAEAAATEFVRPAGQVPALKMRGTMEERGWWRVLHDHGGICFYVKAYPAAGVTAAVNIEPGILLGLPDNQDQQVAAVFFIAGTECRTGGVDGHYERATRLPVAVVDAVAFSETARDLMSLIPAGKG